MSTIQLFVIILPLREKKEQEFEVMEYMEEEENLGMSLDFLDRLYVMTLFGWSVFILFFGGITPRRIFGWLVM